MTFAQTWSHTQMITHCDRPCTETVYNFRKVTCLQLKPHQNLASTARYFFSFTSRAWLDLEKSIDFYGPIGEDQGANQEPAEVIDNINCVKKKGAHKTASQLALRLKASLPHRN